MSSTGASRGLRGDTGESARGFTSASLGAAISPTPASGRQGHALTLSAKEDHHMSKTQESLGRCPNCEADIPASRLLIEYESADGPGVFAECPDCGGVVAPT